MRALRLLALPLAAALILSASRPASAQAKVPADPSLKGLKGVLVVVEDLDAVALSLGLTQDQLTRAVAERLQKGGVTALSRDEWLLTQGRPVLYVNVHFSSGKTKDLYAVSVSVALVQMVLLDRDRDVRLPARTWQTATVGSVAGNETAGVLAQVGFRIDDFAQEFRAANGVGVP